MRPDQLFMKCIDSGITISTIDAHRIQSRNDMKSEIKKQAIRIRQTRPPHIEFNNNNNNNKKAVNKRTEIDCSIEIEPIAWLLSSRLDCLSALLLLLLVINSGFCYVQSFCFDVHSH